MRLATLLAIEMAVKLINEQKPEDVIAVTDFSKVEEKLSGRELIIAGIGVGVPLAQIIEMPKEYRGLSTDTLPSRGKGKKAKDWQNPRRGRK
jgi:hypothetical protein